MTKINKKQQRIKYAVGIYNELNENPSDLGDGDNISYSVASVKSMLATLKQMLKDDGIAGINANSKVNSEE